MYFSSISQFWGLFYRVSSCPTAIIFRNVIQHYLRNKLNQRKTKIVNLPPLPPTKQNCFTAKSFKHKFQNNNIKKCNCVVIFVYQTLTVNKIKFYDLMRYDSGNVASYPASCYIMIYVYVIILLICDAILYVYVIQSHV